MKNIFHLLNGRETCYFT